MVKFDPDARHISGRIQGTGTANADKDLWDGGGQYSFPTSAQIHEIESDDTDDTFGGDGATQLYVEGLDADYAAIAETINMNGTTKVETTNPYLRINRMTVIAVGSIGHNKGTIIATAKDDSTVTAQINPSVSITKSSIFTVPANADFALSEWWAAVSRQVETEVDEVLLVRPEGLVFWTIDTLTASLLGNPVVTHQFDSPILIPARSDIKIRVGANDADAWAMGGYEGKYSRPANADPLSAARVIPQIFGN